MDDCVICCETFNKSNHKKIDCQFCDYSICRTCVQTYLTSTSNDPHCMSCKRAWGREVIDKNCTKVYRNTTLKTHRETILLERERCLLPEAQEEVRRIKQVKEIEKLMEQAAREEERQRELFHELRRQRDVLRMGGNLTGGAGERQKKVFVRKCPIEDCRGFLSSNWKCETCDKHICKDCNEEKGEDHECDPNAVETVKLLAKDTKPCPNCGTLIFKISGCSQMWCPDCHTAFNWNTLAIEKGIIHNPHFYEFQRRTGGLGIANRNNGDIPCGGLPDIGELIGYFHPDRGPRPRRYFEWNTPKAPEGSDEDRIINFHRCVVHMQNYEMPEYREVVANNLDLRVRYLMNELNEDAWKVMLQTREKAQHKRRDITNVLTMFVNTSSDLLRQLVLKDITNENFLRITNELIHYTNDSFKVIHSRYNCVTPWIYSLHSRITATRKTYRGDDK